MDDSDFESNELKPLLVSMKYLKGQYVHHGDEAAYFYDALRPELNVEMNHISEQLILSIVNAIQLGSGGVDSFCSTRPGN